MPPLLGEVNALYYLSGWVLRGRERQIYRQTDKQTDTQTAIVIDFIVQRI